MARHGCRALTALIIGNEVLDAMPVHIVRSAPAASTSSASRSPAANFDWQCTARDWRFAGRRSGARLCRPAISPKSIWPRTASSPHSWRHTRARRRAVHRLRFSGARVLSCAAQQRHVDVPLPPACARRPVLSPRPAGHHRAHRFQRDWRAPPREAGLELLGYASQAQFLINCGITDVLRRDAG